MMNRASSTAKHILFLVFAVFFVVVSLQHPLRAGGRPMILPTDPSPLIVDGNDGQHAFTIEIAKTAKQQEKGLMYRHAMADDHGMLFDFGKNSPLAFWMKNTPMPLDLVFIGRSGKVKAVRHGTPFSTDIISPDEPVQFVLELKAGMAEKSGIADGILLRHPDIAAASHSE